MELPSVSTFYWLVVHGLVLKAVLERTDTYKATRSVFQSLSFIHTLNATMQVLGPSRVKLITEGHSLQFISWLAITFSS